MINKKKRGTEPEFETEITDEAEFAEDAELFDEAGAAAEDAAQEEQQAAEPEQNSLEEELARQKESYLRLAAEYDNFRKRTQREKDALSAEIRCATIAELLPVIDNVERALSFDNASADDLRKGVEMVKAQAEQIFSKLGTEAFGEVGEKFDPNIHNCIGMAPSEDFESGCIILVIQKGYKTGDRVIRTAMVQVAE